MAGGSSRSLGIGDWGLGIGDWGLGIGDWGLGSDKSPRTASGGKAPTLRPSLFTISRPQPPSGVKTGHFLSLFQSIRYIIENRKSYIVSLCSSSPTTDRCPTFPDRPVIVRHVFALLFCMQADA